MRLEREEKKRSVDFRRCDGKERLQHRHHGLERVRGVVLDPLAEVGIGMLVPIVIRCRERMVHLERGRKRRQHQEGQGKGDRDCRSGNLVRGDG